MLHTGRLGTTHFRLYKQVAMIEGHGASVLVLPCLQCPCIEAEKQFSPLCATCHGTGRFYPPSLQFATTLLLTIEDSRRTFDEPGSWTHGTIRASVLPDVRLVERDKVVLVDIRDVYNDETCTKGVDDGLRFSMGVRVLTVADREQLYRAGPDYVLTPPNLITWVAGGQAPAFGSQYSVKYEAWPEYLVVNDSPRLRVEHHIPQSSEVVLMRLDKLSEDF